MKEESDVYLFSFVKNFAYFGENVVCVYARSPRILLANWMSFGCGKRLILIHRQLKSQFTHKKL